MDSNTIDDIAERLDDIATTLEELQEDCSGRGETFERMRQSIEKAVDAIDRLENREADPTRS